MTCLSAKDDTGGAASQLDQLYREIGPRLLAYFHRRHGNPQTAQDLLQETFAAALRKPERLLNAASPRAYLFGVARHLSADAWRRLHVVEELPAELPAADSAQADPRLDVMRESIAKLNPALREVLELRLQAELSYDEIAAVLGIPVGTVRSRLHHAVKQLRSALTRLKPEKR